MSTTVSTAAVQSTPASQAAANPTTAAYNRAYERARREKLVAFRLPRQLGEPQQWECKSYILTETGIRSQDLVCTCEAGQFGRICKHQVPVIIARKYHFNPVRPAVILCANCRDAQVASQGEWCEGCVNLKHSEPIPFPTVRIQRAVCEKCGMKLADPLHEVACG